MTHPLKVLAFYFGKYNADNDPTAHTDTRQTLRPPKSRAKEIGDTTDTR